jgi:hypothetical protein
LPRPLFFLQGLGFPVVRQIDLPLPLQLLLVFLDDPGMSLRPQNGATQGTLALGARAHGE